MCPKIIDKRVKKQEILKAAMTVFARKGVASTKMTDVAEVAGVGKGTIYEYFKSKEEIFSEAFQHFLEQMDSMMAKRLFKIHDPMEKLKVLITGWFDVMETVSTDFIEMTMDFWAEGVRHKQKATAFDLNKMYTDYRHMVTEILEECIAKGEIRPVNTIITASILIGTIDGLMLQWIMDRDLFDLDEAAAVMTDSFIEGLKTRDAIGG